MLAIASVLTVATVAGVAACGQSQGGGATNERMAENSIWSHYESVQPPYQPTGKSVYRDNLTLSEADQVLGLNTTSFFWQNGRDDPYFWCPSRGGAVPNTAQLTNPSLVQPDPNQSSGSVITEAMDPNGVYTPTASTGTYVQCIDSSGRDYLFYAEGEVSQVSAPATWDFNANHGHGGIVVTGAPVMPVCTVVTVNTSSGLTSQTECSDPVKPPVTKPASH